MTQMSLQLAWRLICFAGLHRMHTEYDGLRREGQEVTYKSLMSAIVITN